MHSNWLIKYSKSMLIIVERKEKHEVNNYLSTLIKNCLAVTRETKIYNNRFIEGENNCLIGFRQLLYGMGYRGS